MNLRKNILRNQQLAFCKNMFIAYEDEGEPCIDTLVLRDVVTEENDVYLVYFVDKRENLIKALEKNRKAAISIYFPLSKEKFSFKTVINDKLITDKQRLDYWNNSFGKTDKLKFTKEAPNLKKTAKEEEYNAQCIESVSANFHVLVCEVLKGDHWIYKMPEVVADARNPIFESEFKPYKKEKKFHFERGKDGNWLLEEVNP